MSSTRVEVIVLDNGIRRPLITNGVNKAKLMHFSALAQGQLQPGAFRGRGWPSTAFVLVLDKRATFDENAARTLLKWIDNNDVTDPNPLKTDYMGTDDPVGHPNVGLTFSNGVNLYATAHSLRVPRNLRGDDTHSAIYHYIKDAPLRWDEFAQVIECLSFDQGLVHTAKNNVMFKHVKGGEHETPDFKKIQEYCVDVGIWEEMLSVEAGIRDRMRAQKQAVVAKRVVEKAKIDKQKRERAEMPGRAKDDDFPALEKK